MRPMTHLAWLFFGLAAPTALTFWSISEGGPRDKAHYDRIAAERTDTRAVIERLVGPDLHTDTEIAADGTIGTIIKESKVTIVRVKDGRIIERRELTSR